MFLTLLLVTFLIAATISFLIVWLFTGPIRRILRRIIADEISEPWNRYITFVIARIFERPRTPALGV
jgi:hypothetical protein